MEVLATDNSGKDCWIIADVPSIKVDHLSVYGVLEFINSTEVSAITVLVYGGRLIAGYSQDNPFTEELVFNMRGDHSTRHKLVGGVYIT